MSKTKPEVRSGPRRKASELEAHWEFLYLCFNDKEQIPTPEFKFHPTRMWRFDYAWPAEKVAVEVEGGHYARRGAKRCRVCGQMPLGRHATATGFENDCEKYNHAAALGWAVFRFTGTMLKADGKGCVEQVVDAIRSRRASGARSEAA